MMGLTDFNPATCVTAGELRAIGIAIPGCVPDCGWVPRHAVDLDLSFSVPTDAQIKAGEVPVQAVVNIRCAFRWITVQCSMLPEPMHVPDVDLGESHV